MSTKPRRNLYTKQTRNFWLSVSLVLVLCFLFSVSFVQSARAGGVSLYLSPSGGTYQVDNTFSVVVKTNSGGAAINAADGNLNFNINELEVVKISKTGSIFSFWTTEPTFSNSAGNIVFGGGTPSTFTGSAGTIFTITFRAKIAATTNVNFSSGSVLAADGKGTNVLTKMIGGSYKLQPKVVISEPPAEEEYVPPFTLGVPAAPKIFSTTHSNPEEWYLNNSPKFSWSVPEGITGVRLLSNKNSRTAPTVFYSSPIFEKQLNDLVDGIWYFHCQLQNEFGWGGITHFKFKIDTEPPEPFKIEVKGGKETTNPRPILIFDTLDNLSGIEYYEVKIGDSEGIPVTHEDIETNPYQMPVQAPGKHTVIVTAVDKAGNYALAMTDVDILPIEKPVITDYPKKIFPDTIFSLKGTSVPFTEINVYIEDERGAVIIQTTKTNERGVWYYAYGYPLEEGVYKIWLEAVNLEGARSEPTDKITFSVKPLVFIKIGKFELDYQVTFTALLVLVFLLGVGFILANRKIRKEREELENETREIEEKLRQTFEGLEKIIKEQLDKLEKVEAKKRAGREEEKNKKTLIEDILLALRVAKEYIGKEIEDILRLIKK